MDRENRRKTKLENDLEQMEKELEKRRQDLEMIKDKLREAEIAHKNCEHELKKTRVRSEVVILM